MKASSFVFNKNSKTVESITINEVNCKLRSPIGSDACAEINELSSGKPIVFRANSNAESVSDSRYGVFGNLEFVDFLIKAKLTFEIQTLDDGSELMEGLLIIPAASLRSSDSDINIYIKGKK